MDNFDAAKVTRVYNGKNGKCCCGCAGKYVEKSDPGFARALGFFQRKLRDVVDMKLIDFGGNYLAVENGNRVYIAYFD